MFNLALRPKRDLLSVFDDFERSFLSNSVSDKNDNLLNFTVDVLEKKDKFVLKANLPGVDQKDIKVEVKDGVLTISGERKDEEEVKEDGYYRKESSFGSFTRSFTLNDEIDDNKIAASFKNGQLILDLPKKPEIQDKQKTKLIKIN